MRYVLGDNVPPMLYNGSGKKGIIWVDSMGGVPFPIKPPSLIDNGLIDRVGFKKGYRYR